MDIPPTYTTSLVEKDTCHICNTKRLTKTGFIDHQRQSHPEFKSKCQNPKCHRFFANKPDADEHQGLLKLFRMHDFEAKPVFLCSCDDRCVRAYDLPSFSEKGKIYAKQEARTMQISLGGLFFTGDGNDQTGGRNSVLQCAIQKKLPYITEMPTIIFGANVTHPQPGEDSSPSTAVAVASFSDLYQGTQDPQKEKLEWGMVRELLIVYWESTGLKPGRIIFYRGGVSEGQFSQALLHEVDAFWKACLSLQENYLPRFTFVVVQKRHSRLAQHGDRNSTEKSGHILPGMIVDTKICHPPYYDFYLCSHAGIQGTSRPTRYHVLHDENSFTADGLQMLTNCLCYTYAQCTRSVSVVPSAYYSHLAAFCARYYVEGGFLETGSTSGSLARGTREMVTGS